jgi:selenocysteine lyase/cysteine desulfurase
MTGAQVSAAVRISPVIFNSTTELQPLLEQLSEE